LVFLRTSQEVKSGAEPATRLRGAGQGHACGQPHRPGEAEKAQKDGECVRGVEVVFVVLHIDSF
jgi:hypothetical protein